MTIVTTLLPEVTRCTLVLVTRNRTTRVRNVHGELSSLFFLRYGTRVAIINRRRSV